MIGRAWRGLISIERALLITLLIIGAALFGFFKLASEVAEGDTMAFDRTIMLALRSADPAVPAGPLWLTQAMTDLTAFGGLTGLIFVIAAATGFLLVARRRRTALFVVAATGAGAAAGSLLKLVYDRPRPALVPHLVEVASASFPSGHATDAAIVYLTLGALLARTVAQPALRIYILGAAALLVFLVGVSRVYLGVHWPSDVVAGWTIGAAWALACSLLYSRIVASKAG
jgi:undecaprenyl-diphosphatase